MVNLSIVVSFVSDVNFPVVSVVTESPEEGAIPNISEMAAADLEVMDLAAIALARCLEG